MKPFFPRFFLRDIADSQRFPRHEGIKPRRWQRRDITKKREGTIGVAWPGRGREIEREGSEGVKEKVTVDKPKTRRMRREKQRQGRLGSRRRKLNVRFKNSRATQVAIFVIPVVAGKVIFRFRLHRRSSLRRYFEKRSFKRY